MIVRYNDIDRKKYLAFVDSNPDITGFDSTLHAYLALHGGIQKSLDEFDEVNDF